MNKLAGKVALITGSAGGIGLGIALACAAADMTVVLSDIDEAELERAAADMRTAGASVMAVRLDVTSRADWARVADEVRAAAGPVQLLVNNAGVSTSGLRFDEIDPGLWDRVIDINLTGVYNGVQHFLGAMIEADSGHIVNTSSAGGVLGLSGLTPYCASKFAVVGLSEALRAEFAGTGIGVSVLCPGSVRSRLWRTSRAVRGLPDTDTPPADISGRSARAAMRPDEVGRRVMEAVTAGEFYIFTHPEMRQAVIERHERMLHGLDRAQSFTDRHSPATQPTGGEAE
jgi:NAD(P)-dependent dehydrogenase (short-subunit alcohol dehydrogenase family)